MKKSLEEEIEVLTANELAEYLQLHKQTVYKHVKEGYLPYHRIGRNLLFVLIEVLDACQVDARFPHYRIGRSIRFDLDKVIEASRQDVRPKGGKK